MVDIVEANKRLLLYWQKPGMTLDAYTRDFKAKIDMYEEVWSRIGINKTTARRVFLHSRTMTHY